MDELEAVVARRVVAAGDLDARVDPDGLLGVVEHRRRADADPQHVRAAGREPLDQRSL